MVDDPEIEDLTKRLRASLIRPDFVELAREWMVRAQLVGEMHKLANAHRRHR